MNFRILPRHPARATILALIAVLIGAFQVGATTLQHLDLRALTRESRQIVVGRVVFTRAHWNPTRTMIVTDVDVLVDESIKGATSSTIKLTQWGGEVDGVRVSVPGCASFLPGEEALLFVWRDAKGQAQLTGLGQGKFEISRDGNSGMLTAQRHVPGLEVSDVSGLSAPGTGRPTRGVPLDELKREIRAAMREQEQK